MPPKCRICHHDGRDEIDRLLLTNGDSFRNIAERFGTSTTALHRHKTEHLAERMADVAERNTEADVGLALDVTAQLRRINAESVAILAEAREAGNGALALQAIGAVQKQIELQAKLIDLISDAPQINVNVNAEAVRIELAGIILDELERFPDARFAVAAALDRIPASGGAT